MLKLKLTSCCIKKKKEFSDRVLLVFSPRYEAISVYRREIFPFFFQFSKFKYQTEVKSFDITCQISLLIKDHQYPRKHGQGGKTADWLRDMT